jgi:SAM-dependent methyltransferase
MAARAPAGSGRGAAHSLRHPVMMRSGTAQARDGSSINRETYTKSRVVRSYLGFTELYPAEEYIFSRYERQFSGDVLDIAIGTGRTTRALLPRARVYVGLDFSPAMIEAAARTYPRAELHCADMRAVPLIFKDRQFDAILISFNGLDCISWEDRNSLLRALRFLLRPTGVLAFSTHDLRMAQHEQGFRMRTDLRPRLSVLKSNPARFCAKLVKLPVWALLAWRNHRRNRRNQQFFAGYAYLNDIGENFGLVSVYVARDVQLKILSDSGYTTLEQLQPWLHTTPAVFHYFVCAPR